MGLAIALACVAAFLGIAVLAVAVNRQPWASVAVYGACQGVGNAVGGVAAGYYWKDVQRVQPSAAQFYQGVTDAPWVVKPLWGLLTDVVPVAGYRRRPYFVLAG